MEQKLRWVYLSGRKDGEAGNKQFWGDSMLGVPDGVTFRAGESPEQRAWRRFPITEHKPGGWDSA